MTPTRHRKIFRWRGAPPRRVVVDSDNHYGHHDESYERVKLAVAKDFRPEAWLNLGDHYDCEAISRFDKDPRRALLGLQSEIDASARYWRTVAGMVDTVAFLLGNHEDRLRKTLATVPGISDVRALDWHSLAGLPSRVRVYPAGALVQVGAVWGEHGDAVRSLGGNPAAWALRARSVPTVLFGHHHRPSYAFVRELGHDGAVVTREAYGLGYGARDGALDYAGPVPPWPQSFALVEHFRDGPTWRSRVEVVRVEDGVTSWRGRVYRAGK